MDENTGLVKNEHYSHEDLLIKGADWIKSGLLPSAITKPEQVVVIALKGKELGLETMQSFDFIDVIMGKPSLKPKAQAALIRKGGVKYYTEKDYEPVYDATGALIDYETVIVFIRDGIEERVKYKYTDAANLGLTGKDNWKKQPGIMMYWRCFSKGANRVCPDLISGMYNTEELASFTKGAAEVIITEDGDAQVIETNINK